MKQNQMENRMAEMVQAQLAAIVESSDDAILSKDMDGTILTWNRAAERLYGYTAEEIIGTSVARLMPPEIPDEFSSIMERLRRGVKIDHYDTVRMHKDGHRIEVSISISPLAGPDGELVGAADIAREIGERKRLEQELRETADRIARLQRVTAALSATLEPDQVAEVVVRQAVEALDAWAGLVGLADGDSFRILQATGYSSGAMEQWREFPLSGPYPVSDAVRTGQPVWIGSHEEYRQRYPAMADAVAEQTACAAVLPLLAQGRTIGALVLSFPEGHRFDPQDREFVLALSHQCAQALERSRLYDAERRARQRSAFLAEASAILSSSLDYETTVSNVARFVVPDLADWCMVHLLEPDGTVKPLAVTHADPAKVAWAKEVQERYSPDVRPDQGLGLVLRTGEAQVYNNVTEEMVAQSARDEEERKIVEQIGIRHVLMAPLVARGRTLGVLTFIRGAAGAPYTEADRTLAEDLARRCALAVDNALLFREAQALNRAKDEFQAMLAHELRNPIGAISNALYLLDRANSREPVAGKQLGIASRQLRHVTRLLDDLLDVSRITRGKVHLRLATVDLSGIVREAAQSARPGIEKRRHRLVVNLPEEPVCVEGDTDRLVQVVLNLLDNAAKYTPDGGRIAVCLKTEGSDAVLRVRDNGSGISKELLPHIFDLFTQADRALDRPEGGLGIGLTVVKSLVEMHGGTIQAVSAGPNRGCEMLIRLPLSSREGILWEIGGREDRQGADARMPGRRVLLVEDNPDAAETLAEILEMWGHAVRVAADGPAALRLFQENPPDVVLLDIGLPGMDGYEVGKRLRAMDQDRKTLLVAISGYNQPEDQAKSRTAGFDRHLAKPVDTTALRELLESGSQKES